MIDEPVSNPGKAPKSQRTQHREGRLKAALKANMAKRKLQTRARSEDETKNADNETETG